ncbi:MAG: outer membrane beta-barrel protein [Bacteroidetes bacterium]|jgi:hypothetical protein|nr:outer membrane beta-barrel protein [Bacteroidota bacterium]
MRSSALLLLVLLCAALPARSSAQTLSYGLRIGISGATLTGAADTDFEPRTGLTGGFAMGYDFGNGFTLMPELLYVTKGAYFDDTFQASDGASVPVRARYDLTYIEIPLLLTYRFGHGSVRPLLRAGPSLGYNVIAQLNLEPRGEDSLSQSFNDETIQSIDYGLVAGAGAEVLFRGERLVFEARVILGQSDVRDEAPALSNRSVLLLAGFAF